MIIPTKMTIMTAAVIGLGIVGALAALAAQQSIRPSSIRDTSGEVLKAAVTAADEQSSEVRVNGMPVPLDNAGNAHVTVPGSNSTITVSDNGKNVTASTDNSTSNTNANSNLNVSISSQSNGGSNFTNTFLHSSSRSGSSTQTSTNVQQNGTGNVQVNTTP